MLMQQQQEEGRKHVGGGAAAEALEMELLLSAGTSESGKQVGCARKQHRGKHQEARS